MGRQKNKVNRATEVYWHDAVEELFANPEKTIKQVAQERNMNDHTLNAYILNHYRERWEEFCREERLVTRGRRSTRAERYEKAAAYIKEHPEELLESVAYRFDIYKSAPMTKYITRHYPDLLPWRKECNKWRKRNEAHMDAEERKAKRAELEEAKKAAEREKRREQDKKNKEKKRAWYLAELDAPVVPFAERMEAMQKRLNDIRDGLGDTFNPGDLPLLKITSQGYSVMEWHKKQHTLDIIMRRMEQVRRMRGLITEQ